MRSLISFLSSVRWIIRLIGFLMHSYRWWGWKDRNITSVNPKRISWLQMSFLAPQKTRGKVSNVAQKLHFCWVNLTSLEFLSEHWLTNSNRKILHSGAKNHISSKNSHVQNYIFQEIHIFKISFLAKFTCLKSHF